MNDLHRDVLTQGISEFEQSLLKTTICAARRTRRVRCAVRTGAALAVMVCAFFLWFPKKENSALVAYTTVTNSALPSTPPDSRLVTFRTQPFAGMLRTKPLPVEQKLLSSARHLAVFRTSDRMPEIHKINDEELLSLFEGQAVALVGRGPNAKLVFPNKDSETR